jgi:hypothetical protein
MGAKLLGFLHYIRLSMMTVLVVLSSQRADAASYTYSGNEIFNTYYGNPVGTIDATVDLNCTGPCAAGSYDYSAGGTGGISDFTITTLYGGSGVSLGPNLPTYGFGFVGVASVTLDSLGNIISWDIEALLGTFYQFSTVGPGPGSEDFSCDCDPGPGHIADNVNDPGTWSQVATPVATPIPAALPLFATGLSVMGLLGWRRKRKSAHPGCLPISSRMNRLNPLGG